MASTDTSREAFVEGVLRFLVHYDFDGLDFDWEYPTQRGGIAEDKPNFVALLRLLRVRLSKWNLMLTVAVPLSTGIVAQAYDMYEIGRWQFEFIAEYEVIIVMAFFRIVDYVFLMAYDYTPVDSDKTGLLAPMNAIVSN